MPHINIKKEEKNSSTSFKKKAESSQPLLVSLLVPLWPVMVAAVVPPWLVAGVARRAFLTSALQRVPKARPFQLERPKEKGALTLF